MVKRETIVFKYRLFFILLFTLISLILGFSFYECHNNHTFNELNEVNKCILFIGDGMGEAHVKTAESYFGHAMSFTSFPYKGYVTTSSLNLVGPTDSAAAASALATGIKYQNGVVALNNGPVKSISEYYKEAGLGVGIITTDNLSGATPAGFSAHANNRSDTKDIINTQLESGIDLLIGAGVDTYTPFEETIKNNGYQFVTSFSDLKVSSNKILATFNKVSYHDNSDTNPTLASLALFAYKYMEANYQDGYFLMIEGAHIDKRSHDNNIISMVNYLNAFDEAINLLYNKLANDSYLILVTADHETGHLDYNGESREEINNGMYKSTGHTSRNVPYYIATSLDNLSDLTPLIDNTDVFKIFMQIRKKKNV